MTDSSYPKALKTHISWFLGPKARLGSVLGLFLGLWIGFCVLFNQNLERQGFESLAGGTPVEGSYSRATRPVLANDC